MISRDRIVACAALRYTTVLVLMLPFVACGGDKNPVQSAPPAPQLVLPQDGATLANGCFDKSQPVDWDFDWTDVPGANAYHLYVKAKTATYPVVDQQGIPTSWYRSSSGGGYYSAAEWEWRVRAMVGGTYGEWSSTRTFYVEPPRNCVQ